MSVYKEYHHVIKSLEVYPRVHFFSKRYHDIKEKYRKFTDRSLKKWSINHDEAPQNCLENGLTIKVVGKEDLDPIVFIATEPHLFKTLSSAGLDTETDFTYDTIVPVDPYKDCTRPSSYPIKKVDEAEDISTPASTAKEGEAKSFGNHTTTVVICNAVVESLNDQALEDIKLLCKRFGNPRENQSIGYFLLCQSNQAFMDSEENVFRCKLVSYFGYSWKLIHIFTRGSKEVKIGNDVSLYLEDKLVQNLLTVESGLQPYTTGKRRSNTPKPLLEEENVKEAIRYFLQQVPKYGKEIKKSTRVTGSVKGSESTEKQMTESSEAPLKWTRLIKDKSMIRKLALIVKCCVVQALSTRHNITVKYCNNILIQVDFEEKCLTLFLKSVKYCVTKLWYYAQITKFNVELQRRYQSILFPRVLTILQEDLFSFVTGVEKDVCQFATTLRKLLFEISSCLKKTKIDVETMKQHATLDKGKVDINLRKKILSIKEVYGVGTVYGQLEIHVNEIGAIERVESRIQHMLRKENVSCTFSVRAIDVKLELLADHSFHEHGERIECETRKGTLAGFLEGSDQRLYGLTCAHVVKAEDECDVFIYDGANSRLEFAKCVPHLIVSTGSPQKPLIDLAAVRVIDHIENRCLKFLKNEESLLRPGVIAADTTEELAGNPVYKHGATSQLTKGLVSSDDYSILSSQDRHYIFLIENYNDEEDDVFAMPGDSGSMICTPYEEQVYIVKAVGVLNGRTVTPNMNETQKFFSFRLIDGLRKLSEKAGDVQFNFPNNC